MTTSSAAAERIRDNAFHVLGLRPSASRAEIEREGQKLLGLLELGIQSAASYPTPAGKAKRTADKVRQAMADLRDPERRLEHEIWARLEPSASSGDEPSQETGARARPRADAPWPDALVALGWRARR
jgi:curved DNA-binding protein CbpA